MQKSYLSKRAAELKPSGIRKFFDIVATMKDVISLGIGEPDFTTPKPILDAGIRSLTNGETHYTSNSGKIELRQGIADNLKRLYNVNYDPATEIIATVGVSEALYLTFNALLDPGDEVIIPTPCFVSYQAEVYLAGGIPVEIPSRRENNFSVDPADIRKAITPRTKVIFIGYPSNPTGAVAERETMIEIAKIAEEFDLMVVSDEIYDRLVYGFEHVCFPALGESLKRRTVLLGGFSKSHAMTGWRIGYAAAPAEIIAGLVRIHQYTIMSAPTTAQDAAIEALKSGEPHVEEMRSEYNRRRKLIVGGLNRLGLDTFEPRGAFYAFPNIQASGMDDESFAEKLLQEERVAVVPGSAFGMGGEGFVRCSYATSYEKIEEALRRMEKFMERHG
ncbi:MAG: aromatic amino acid aminotransferase [Chloroflexi bacterium HGW-Chloroflexi-6]|nr:MAG: aromatic amino acid aminotransferase [Chloroflexi bacterium HGW-Chloroflexi-6]